MGIYNIYTSSVSGTLSNTDNVCIKGKTGAILPSQISQILWCNESLQNK